VCPMLPLPLLFSTSYVLCAQCYQCLSCFLRPMSCVPNVTNASPVFYVLCLVCPMLPMPLLFTSSYVLCAQCYQCLSCFLRPMSCVPNVTNASPVFYVLCLVCLMLPMPLQLSLWFIFNLEKTDVKKQSDSNLDFKRRHSRCLVSNI
jgi:hypothetical protein